MKKIVILFTEDLHKHYLLCQRQVFVYIYDLESKISSVEYCDAVDLKIKSNITITDQDIIFTPDKKLFDRFYEGPTSYDIRTQYWLHYGKVYKDIYEHEILKQFSKFYKGLENWVRYVPSVKLQEVCDDYINTLYSIPEVFQIEECNRFYSTKVYPAITGIEKNGLYVSQPLFNTLFSREYSTNYVWCYYNLHTTTGRPSNTFDTINYNALNKKDGTRSAFISRFDDKGVLVEFDLDAYHLRLISQIIDYEFPDESVHDYFAKQYFKTSTVTDTQYKESKSISFRLLYGGITEAYSNINFFQRVEGLKDKLWNDFKTQGYIKSPISGKTLKKDNLSDINSSKLFNYLLQTIETEYSIIFIEEINAILKDKKSKLILYTYDSFLIDYNLEDGKDALLQIGGILKHSKIRVGRDYHNLFPYVIPKV